MDKGGVGNGKRTASSNGSDPSLLQGPPAKKEMRRIGLSRLVQSFEKIIVDIWAASLLPIIISSADLAPLSSSRKAKLRDEAASGDAL